MDSPAGHLDPAYRGALIVCASLNLAMLFVEDSVGLLIGSAALLADAVDFLEDAAVLSLAIVALNWSISSRAKAGLVQGLAMGAVGIVAMVQIVRRLIEGGAPSAILMGSVALLALAVNVYCAYRLVRLRTGDASMRAIWLSSRNDAVLNILTAIAAGVIALTGSGWPDILVGATTAAINLWAVSEITGTALKELQAGRGG